MPFLMITHNLCFRGEIKTNINTFWIKKKKKKLDIQGVASKYSSYIQKYVVGPH